MANQSKSLISRSIGIVLLEQDGASESAEDRRNLDYLNYEYALLSRSLTCDHAEYSHFRSDWLETGNEIEVAQRMLLRAGRPLIPPAEWRKPDADAFGTTAKAACSS